MGLEYYYIPVPIGLFIFLCAVCLRVARSGNRANGRRRVIVIRRTNQTAIPSQFEHPGAPIITSEEGYDQRPNDFPPTYEDAQRYHHWQQQQRLQHPPPQGAYVKAMNGWSQPQQPGEVTGALPIAQGNPPPPNGLMQPGMVAGNNGAGWSQHQQQPDAGEVIGAPLPAQANPPPPYGHGIIQPVMVAGNIGAASTGMVAGNNGAASTGMLLDVTTLPCASAQSPPSQTVNE